VDMKKNTPASYPSSEAILWGCDGSSICLSCSEWSLSQTGTSVMRDKMRQDTGPQSKLTGPERLLEPQSQTCHVTVNHWSISKETGKVRKYSQIPSSIALFQNLVSCPDPYSQQASLFIRDYLEYSTVMCRNSVHRMCSAQLLMILS